MKRAYLLQVRFLFGLQLQAPLSKFLPWLQILPIVRKHKVIHFEKTDTRLANNGLPLPVQKLRCRVNYDALMFTPRIEALGQKLISILKRNNYFIVLHLRYEMDMLSFSGCSHGCSDEEAEELTRKRFVAPIFQYIIYQSDIYC